MKTDNALYEIMEYQYLPDSGVIEAKLSLNAGSDIFKGHFPQTPVLPGVSMLQIIRILTERSLGRKLQLTAASNIKYLSLVQPDGEPLYFTITVKGNENGSWNVTNTLLKGAVVCMKFSGTYKTK